MKAAVEQIFNGSLEQVAFGGAYDPAKINRGKHTGQFNLGSGQADKFIGPAPVGIANMGQSSLAIPSHMLHPIKITDDLYWVFGADGATAATTRRVQLWTFVPSTNTYNLVGAINCGFPTATAHTVRGIRAILDNYTKGTVGVSGTAVAGSGTAFNTDRLCVGSRIGFGSTDPNDITTWYHITAIGSDTSITINTSAGAINSGTPYVIQDLMIVQATTNATATNGGLFVVKGLSYNDFQNPTQNIGTASTTDRVKAVYWLRDAATITNTAIGGCALGDLDNRQQQYVYCTNGAASSLVIYRYNIRAALTPVSGGFTLTGTDILITGAQSVTGTLSQNNNGRVGTLNHGAGNGVPSIYLFTTTRIIRVAITNITSGNTTFVSDTMIEVPPGGTETNVSFGSITGLDISVSLDKLVIIGTASTAESIYITDYYTTSVQIDRRSGSATSQMISSLRDSDSPVWIHFVTTNSPFLWVEDGWMFWIYSTAATANLNAFSAYPLAADLDFQADVNNRVICPAINLGSTPAKLYRVLANDVQNLGDLTMGVAPDMFRIQVRTSGISDNSGSWTDVPQDGDLSGLGTPSEIQFAFQFRTAGVVMLPARVLALALVYETDDALPSQYRWNYSDFNTSNGTFAWVQSALFAGSPTIHTIEIYRADTNALVLTQASTGTTNGAFEYWTGSAWAAGLGSNVVGTRRRFVPTGSLPGSVDLYAKIIVS